MGGQEAAAQEAAEEAVILSLRGLGAALPDWVVVVVVALVAHGRGLGGAVAVSSSDRRSLGRPVRVLGHGGGGGRAVRLGGGGGGRGGGAVGRGGCLLGGGL